MNPQEFVSKWKKINQSERSVAHSHFIDLCAMLGQPAPTDADHVGDDYKFEKGLSKTGGDKDGKQGWADVWYRDHFAWEYKKKHSNLKKAYDQLLQYRESLLNPPLLIVCDLHNFEIHTNFTGTAKKVYQFSLDNLAEPKNLDILRRVFTDPDSLKVGTRTTAEVTEVAAKEFAKIADLLRKRGIAAERAISAIEKQSPRADILVKEYMKELGSEVVSLNPDVVEDGNTLDVLVMTGIEASIPLVIEFANLVKTISHMEDKKSATALHEGFEHILWGYDRQKVYATQNGNYYREQFDVAKFLGHELYTTFISFLLEDERWDILSLILEKYVQVPPLYGTIGNGEMHQFSVLSKSLKSLDLLRNKKLNLNLISVHADILHERHIQGELAELVPFNSFAFADYFLYLREQFYNLRQKGSNQVIEWLPRTVIYMLTIPNYLIKAESIKYANQIAEVLSIDNYSDLKNQFLCEPTKAKIMRLDKVFSRKVEHIPYNIWEKIGSKP